MYKINDILNYPLQTKILTLPTGEQLTITLYFVSMQNSWFIRELTYLDFIARNIKVVASPNLLRQFKNIIPFGLLCSSSQGRDPQLMPDFFSGANALYVLSEEEVDNLEESFSAR